MLVLPSVMHETKFPCMGKQHLAYESCIMHEITLSCIGGLHCYQRWKNFDMLGKISSCTTELYVMNGRTMSCKKAFHHYHAWEKYIMHGKNFSYLQCYDTCGKALLCTEWIYSVWGYLVIMSALSCA